MTPRTRQSKLTSAPGADLPGPDFVHRPGWGGQLTSWLGTHGHTLVFRIALLAAAVLITTSIWHTLPPADAPTVAESSTAVSETAIRGDGISNLAGRALDRYLITNAQSLTPEERLWAIQVLIVPWTGLRLEPGMTIDFNAEGDFSAIITDAKAITPAQRAKLRAYLK